MSLLAIKFKAALLYLLLFFSGISKVLAQSNTASICPSGEDSTLPTTKSPLVFKSIAEYSLRIFLEYLAALASSTLLRTLSKAESAVLTASTLPT